MKVKELLRMLAQEEFNEKYRLGSHHYFESRKGKHLVICYNNTNDIILSGTYKAIVKFLEWFIALLFLK